MKKQFITLKIDSVVDVITNSSSEIFVGKATQSIEFVAQYLRDILDEYNEKESKKHSFSECFGEIYFITEDNLSEFIDRYVMDWGFVPGDIKTEHYISSYDRKQVVLKDGTVLNANDYDREYYRASDEKQKQMDSNRDRKAEKELEEKYDKSWLDRNMKELKKLVGHVCILSKEDNSIPYELFDKIQTAFKADRCHLG